MKTFYDFRVWCENAVSGIRYHPDRKMVYGELLDHLYDHYDDLVAQGMDSESAQRAALEAMGSAREIAPQLAAIHRPFWGRVLTATRVLLILSLCAVVLSAGFWFKYVMDYSVPYDDYNVDPYTDNFYENYDSSQNRRFYIQPQQAVQSDGYTLTLTQAALWDIYTTDSQQNTRMRDCLYIQFEVFHPLPWAEEPGAMDWIWAVDSLGNVYDSFHKGIINYAPYIWVSSHHTGLLTYTYNMEINDYRSQEAEWIEFHYDRSGRDLVWRVSLPGGDAA